MLEDIKKMILEKKEYIEASKIIFEDTVENNLDDLIVLKEDGLKDTVLGAFKSDDPLKKYYGKYLTNIQKALHKYFDEAAKEIKNLADNKELIKEFHTSANKHEISGYSDKITLISGEHRYEEDPYGSEVVAKALSNAAKKFVSENEETKNIFKMDTSGYIDRVDGIPGVAIYLNTPKKISLTINGESKSFKVSYEENDYNGLTASIIGLNFLAQKEDIKSDLSGDSILVKKDNILQFGEKEVHINKILDPSIFAKLKNKLFGESAEDFEYFDEAAADEGEQKPKQGAIDKDIENDTTSAEDQAALNNSIDDSVEDDDSILDASIDDRDLLTNDIDDTELVGKQTCEPIELDDNDILSVTIDLKSNTVTDVLPIPPDNAGEALSDDILATRVDSGFEESTYNESVIGGIVATVLIAPILISGAMAATLLISHKLNERSVTNKIKKATGKDLTASELKKKINSDLNDFYQDVDTKFSKLFEGTPKKNTVFDSANISLKEVSTSKESSEKIMVADHDIMGGQSFIIKRTNLKKLEALANKHPLFKIAITENTDGDLLYDDAYESIKNGSLDMREESFRDPDLLKDILKTYAFVSMHVLVDIVTYVQHSFNESALSFLEAISLTGDDSSNTEEAPADVQQQEKPKENEVTAAVKDKVTEAEEDVPEESGSDQLNSDASGIASTKEELLKKLSSITKSLEDAKSAVLKAM